MPFLNVLIEGEMVQAFPFYEIDAGLHKAIDKILDFLTLTDVTSEKDFQKLHWEYTCLFIGPGKGQAPPWESMYIGGEPFYFSKQCLQVRCAYQKYQLMPRRVGHDPDDHIGLELDFMHKLCEMAKSKTIGDDQRGVLEILEDQKRFLEDHLLKWVPIWTKEVMKYAKTGFYNGAVQTLNAYIGIDNQLIEAYIGAV